MPRYQITSPDGKTWEVNAPEGATQDQVLEYAKSQWSKQAAQPKPPVSTIDPTEGMSRTEKVLAGVGKAFADTGFGAKQLGAEALNLVGLVPDATVQSLRKEADERKERDKPLMNSGWGLAGNVGGNVALAIAPGAALGLVGTAAKAPALASVGRSLITAPATLPGVAAGAGAGALQGAVQPVGTEDSRLFSTGAGALGGGIVPALGLSIKGIREALRPATEGGRRAIVGSAISKAAGNDPQILNRLRGATELVPGALPTAADVADNGGIAALQRAAAAIDPQAYAARNASKVDAWRSAIADIAGDDGRMVAAEAAREAAAKPLYHTADQAVVQLDGFFSGLMKRPGFAAAVDEAAQLAKNSGIDDLFFRDAKGNPIALTGEGAHLIKKALDDATEYGGKAYVGKGNAGSIASTQRDFLGWLSKQVPEYDAARAAFADASKPINQMLVGRELQKSMNPALAAHGQITGVNANQFAKALQNAPRVVKDATGQPAKSLADVMTPQQMQTLNGLAGDFARMQNANNLGRGVGSDTVQKLAMTNLLERTGIPVGVLDVPYLGGLLNWGYQGADDKMKGLLAEALLDPKKTAELIELAGKKSKVGLLGAGVSYTSRPLLQGLLASELAQ